LVGIAILILVALALTDQFARPRSRAAGPGATVKSRPESNRGILYALRDLDFDYQTGKVSDADYRPLRRKLLSEAAAGLTTEERGRQVAVAQLERAVRAQRKVVAVCPQCGSGFERGQRYCSRCGSPLSRSCTTCGELMKRNDAFCSACGAPSDDRVGEIE
jgi:RNA polymerase subunit RPABC4/transcription elongation factor Spt4